MARYVAGQNKRFSISSLILYLVVILFAAFCLLPFVQVIATSFTTETAIVKYGYRLLPRVFSTEAYKLVLSGGSKQIYKSYLVTIIVTLVGTVSSLVLILMTAYPLTRKGYKLRNIFNFYIFFTMLFNGGMVPWFILCTNYLHLQDNYFALIVPYLVPAWNVFLMRNFLATIPDSIEESARIDGAGDYRILFQIYVPLAKPGIATIALFTTLMYWNDWWLGLMLTNGNKLLPLQLYLMQIIQSAEFIRNNVNTSMLRNSIIPTETVRMAIAVLAVGPIIFAYPFFQKYIIRGLVVGAVKG
jgi:ABC-type sugar transport system, permease component